MMKKIGILFLFLFIGLNVTFAQESGNFLEGENIQSVVIEFKNPLDDDLNQKNLNAKIELLFPVYPQTTVRTILLDAYAAKVKQLPEVADAYYEVRPSLTGDINVTLKVTLSDTLKDKPSKSGVLAGGKDFPLLYLDNKSLLTTKFALAEMLYSNNNSWYGRDDAMLQGNPLVDGPAGKGYTGWFEGWVSGGIYGITTLSNKRNIYLYGGASFIMSGSAGRELFTDVSRIHTAFDDAYVGFFGTKSFSKGNLLSYNFSVGRQQFTIGNGFIIRNTASNGGDRAALQLNPRWAADYLGLATIKYNNLMLQVFQINPDELPIIDSRTVMNGFNTEYGINLGHKVGFTYLNVSRSDFGYYTPTGDVFRRNGLNLYNIRYFKNLTQGNAGLLIKTELAHETNSNFKMSAFAGYGEIGWSFAKAKASPTFIYRFSYFSGDDPTTKTFERWDPLLTGGNGEDWVLGANHFKIVQNSNLIAHKIQASLRVSKKVELVPQYFYFLAANNNNVGGNPALSYMPQKEYGQEVNLTWKYFHSRKWYFHGHFAQTIPGAGVKEALGGDAKSWFSAMLFFRYSLN
ncbi:hypothetical protein [Flavobacterium sp.]|uniref:hypothetical protein n=1 Tax=Flavobacterium sp. TaxID=239 RepID=UPI0022C33598|nr:hypothetical protein [Flavobacterium sp.]MCZ8230471.1 hypothetical protein [Flavobacterium sp.]